MKIMSHRNSGDLVNNESPAFLSDIIFISGKQSLLFCIFHTFVQQFIYENIKKRLKLILHMNMKAVYAKLREVQNNVIARYVTYLSVMSNYSF